MKADASSIILKVINWVLFIVGVLGIFVGVVLVYVISMQEERQRTQYALVQSGEIERADAIVTEKRIDERRRGAYVETRDTPTKVYKIVVRVGDSKTVVRRVNRADYDSIEEGETYDAYLIDGKHFIPRFDAQTHDYVKWIILAVFVLPMLCAIALFILRMTMVFRARSHEAKPKATVS